MTVQLSTNCIITSNMDDLFKQNPSRVSLHFQFLFSLYAILGQDVNLMYLLDLSTKGDGNCRSESLVKTYYDAKKFIDYIVIIGLICFKAVTLCS